MYKDVELTQFDFYPRPPRGGRPSGQQTNADTPIGISIHALREEGDFDAGKLIPFYVDISIHALREEGDTKSIMRCTTAPKFLSTPSARRAT